MHNMTKIALATVDAETAGRRVKDTGASVHEVGVECMRTAIRNFMRPTEDEAFIAAAGALTELYPEKKEAILAEGKHLGDKSKLVQALIDGLPIDMSRVDVSPMPEDAIGLTEMYIEATEGQ